MIRIIATPEQAQAIESAAESVEIVDAAGNRIGYVARPFSNDDVQTARNRLASSEPRKTTAEVLARLQGLAEE